MNDWAIVRYDLDSEDTITEIDGPWPIRSPIGRSIWDFVRGSALRALYTHIFERTRTSGRELELPYRCDTDELRRHLLMKIIPRADGGLSVENLVHAVVPRHEPLAVVSAARGQILLLRCSVCNFFGNGQEWIDVVDAASAKRILDDDRPVRVLYGVCPKCRAELRRAAGS